MKNHSIITSTPSSYNHVVHFDGAIEHPEVYRDLIELLRNAGPLDNVHILIDSPGGSLSITTGIISAMAQTQAYVITEVTGMCASAATLVFLAGTECRIGEFAQFMIHTASYGTWGNAPSVKDYVHFSDKQIEALVRNSYNNFLDAEELDDVLRGREIWLNAEEVLERLEFRNEMFELEQEELAEKEKEKQQAVVDKVVLDRMKEAVEA